MLQPLTPLKLTPEAVATLRRSGFTIEFAHQQKPIAERIRRSYNQCRKLGLCVRCGEPAKTYHGRPGVLCEMHSEMNRVASMERRARLKR